MQSQKPPIKVAVIGAGASGLVAARELRREGHQVVVFERNHRVGGTWLYDPSIDSDPLSLDPSRIIVHSSLYYSLRTNLPRESMGFRDFPFIAKYGEDRDPRRFPSHKEVLHYLEDFASEFKLGELIRFHTEVVQVEFTNDEKWVVKSRSKYSDLDDDGEEETYDAVVVCNGHHTKPRIVEIPGIDVWPGKQIHSHNYRVPDPFDNKVVVLIGYSHSGSDISRDVARVAKEVHVASKSGSSANPTKLLGYDNLWVHSMIKSAHEDGTIMFQDGSSVLADVILHCTGYNYDFPFLKMNDFVSVDDGHVAPLYQHIFPPKWAPWLSFIGLTWKVPPFPMYELQSKWVAGILSGKYSLPSQEKMVSEVEAFHSRFEADGVPKRYIHNIMDYQYGYYDWLAVQCKTPVAEKWRFKMHEETGRNRVVRPETYRDEWEDDDLIEQAHQDFLQYMQPNRDINL